MSVCKVLVRVRILLSFNAHLSPRLSTTKTKASRLLPGSYFLYNMYAVGFSFALAFWRGDKAVQVHRISCPLPLLIRYFIGSYSEIV